jgi:hypothetical protein
MTYWHIGNRRNARATVAITEKKENKKHEYYLNDIEESAEPWENKHPKHMGRKQ